MNLLHVLGRLVMLEPRQANLLNRILEKPLIGLEALGLKQENADDSSKVSADL
ncbi:hypothetical protein FHX15_000239 [Rhizobium sp. BK650]|uniref:hypothetical protein n=1 Tax=Rhizobium sp. BK650 TaxID=2586990 RepID=UPI0018474BF1|nr:hypothetical protein [Rhizobium sp. BK650]MBB3655040.1 hypothetical protein [Rhizobium sp. BK650]